MTEPAKETESDKGDQLIFQPTITEQEKELATVAYEEFQKKNYEACTAILNELLETRPNDPKVLLNKVVVGYYASEFKKTEDFQKALGEIASQAQVNLDNVESLEDVDHCVIFFNQALILFHLHQYYATITILDKLFQFIEPLDETLARKICFLLLEVYLCTHQPEKALSLIRYIETTLFGGNKTSNDNKTQSSDKEKEKENKDNKEKETSNLNQNEAHRPRLQHYKARCYIMLKSAKFCKREIKSLMNSGINIPAIYLRSQLEYLRGNYRKALKVLNTATSTNVRPFVETGDNIPVMYYNNVGCIHFYMGKPNLASFYFSKAIQEHENAIQNLTNHKEKENLSSRPLPTMNIVARYHLLYNLGIQYLHMGRPNKAFDCLIEAVRVYHINPRLWLRISECCIHSVLLESQHNFNLSERKRDMVQKVVGNGSHRKIILSPFLSNNYKISQNEQTSAMPAPTLEFASFCVHNALMLLPEDSPSSVSNQSGTGDESEISHQLDNSTSVIALPSNPIQGTEIASLRNSILVASAYIALCLGDLVVALKHAEALLSQSRLSGIHKLLAHLYAAEALILMDRIADAIQHLNPEHIKDISFSLPCSGEGELKGNEKTEENNKPSLQTQNWSPTTVTGAKMIMLYNMAVAYTLRGELEKAAENLRQVGVFKGMGSDIPAQAVMLAIYIQLQQGHADLARSTIKQHLPQYR